MLNRTRSTVGTMALVLALPLSAQTVTNDPFPDPISTEGGATVGYQEFATLPDIDGVAARMMTLQDEPTSRRLFVNDQRGVLYTVSYDGRTVTKYLDMNTLGVQVQSQGRERGMQSFALHPQFAQQGTPGYGKIYSWVDVMPAGSTDFQPGGGQHTNDNVLLEFTARSPAAATYDGEPPRELFRIEDPFQNHNGGRTAFNPLARPGDADYGLLYQGVADGGSGGEPLNNAQNLGSIFGKIIRIDPLGRNSSNGKYGIPASNPFAGDNDPKTLGEIYAYGIRNSQSFAWDRTTGRMFATDIGQNTVEEVSVVTAGANLGWNVWEGSYRFVSGQNGGVDTSNPRSDPKVTYPIVEFAQVEPLFASPQVASTGLAIYRDGPIAPLRNKVLFGDLPSGEMFFVSADDLPRGGQSPIRRVLFNDGGQPKKLLELIQAKNRQQGKNPVNRADLRFHPGNDGRIYVLNKGDGVIRVLVP